METVRKRMPSMEIDETILQEMRMEKAKTGKYLHEIVEEALRSRYARGGQ